MNSLRNTMLKVFDKHEKWVHHAGRWIEVIELVFGEHQGKWGYQP